MSDSRPGRRAGPPRIARPVSPAGFSGVSTYRVTFTGREDTLHDDIPRRVSTDSALEAARARLAMGGYQAARIEKWDGSAYRETSL